MATGHDTVLRTRHDKVNRTRHNTAVGTAEAPRTPGNTSGPGTWHCAALRCLRPAAPLALAVVLAACAGGGIDTGSLALPSVAMPKVELPKVDISKIELPKVVLEPGHPVVGSPTEVYTRVAQGAVTCWFGAHGPLKGRYIYHASAESPSRGGRAEISVHERDDLSKDPRGGRALKIFITPEGEQTMVSYENQRISSELSEAMRRDVDRWAGGKTGCEPIPAQTAWNAETQRLPEKPAANATKAKTKAKAATPARAAAAR